MNKCTSPHLQKILPTERKSVWIVTICSGIWGTHTGLCLPNWKVWERQEGKEGVFLCNSTFLQVVVTMDVSLALDTHSIHCWAQIWTHIVCKLLLLDWWLLLFRAALRAGGSGSACPHRMGCLAAPLHPAARHTAQGLLPPSVLQPESLTTRSFPGSLGPCHSTLHLAKQTFATQI